MLFEGRRTTDNSRFLFDDSPCYVLGEPRGGHAYAFEVRTQPSRAARTSVTTNTRMAPHHALQKTFVIRLLASKCSLGESPFACEKLSRTLVRTKMVQRNADSVRKS
jgi:hypothetical protein